LKEEKKIAEYVEFDDFEFKDRERDTQEKMILEKLNKS